MKKSYYDLEKLYEDLCRKAFRIEPFRAKVRFKKFKHLLGATDFWECPDKSIERLKIGVLKKIRFSNAIAAQILIHEITHLVSHQKKHNDKFYRVYFKAAETKFGRRFF